MTRIMDAGPAPVRMPPAATALKTLVLNADGRPLNTFPLSVRDWRKAVEWVCRGKVDVVETWPGMTVSSPSTTIEIPKVVMERRYVDVRTHRPVFNRITVALRDRFSCQYCGQRRPMVDLSFDHVVPRSKGGRTTWENIVMACAGAGGCNSRKASQPANHSGRKGKVGDGNFRPLKEPREPTAAELYIAGFDFIPPSLAKIFPGYLPETASRAMAELKVDDLGLKYGWANDTAYWTVELER
jgi:5-methylcytosine-specific restriction endonuclease McrA